MSFFMCKYVIPFALLVIKLVYFINTVKRKYILSFHCEYDYLTNINI